MTKGIKQLIILCETFADRASGPCLAVSAAIYFEKRQSAALWNCDILVTNASSTLIREVGNRADIYALADSISFVHSHFCKQV